jgi:NAD(P)-dependent dehydrogenase (short-subunit alcohol dehydrogenase family)
MRRDQVLIANRFVLKPKSVMKTPKTWIITAALRGFGFEISKAVLDTGDNVVARVRSKPEELASRLGSRPHLHVALLDINDEAQAAKIAAETVEKFGSIDVLANNAGFGLLGGVEEVSDAEARRVYDTNVFGLLKACRGHRSPGRLAETACSSPLGQGQPGTLSRENRCL